MNSAHVDEATTFRIIIDAVDRPGLAQLADVLSEDALADGLSDMGVKLLDTWQRIGSQYGSNGAVIWWFGDDPQPDGFRPDEPERLEYQIIFEAAPAAAREALAWTRRCVSRLDGVCKIGGDPAYASIDMKRVGPRETFTFKVDGKPTLEQWRAVRMRLLHAGAPDVLPAVEMKRAPIAVQLRDERLARAVRLDIEEMLRLPVTVTA